MDLRPLTDAELLARLRALAASERECVADVVEHLAEMERRDGFELMGCASLFDYCTRVLLYSEAGAMARINAARAARASPRVIQGLRSGSIHLDSVARLARHMTPENSGGLLDLASGATCREVKVLVASLDDAPVPRRDVVRVVSAAPSSDPTIIPPPDKIRIAFTAEAAFHQRLEQLKSLLRHRIPSGSLEEVLDDAVSARLLQLIPKAPKRQKTAAPRKGRRIPTGVKAAVWARDAGRCVYTGPDGLRCGRTDFIQFDHIVPWSRGGPSTVENIRLLCRPHNLLLARRTFGSKVPSKRAQLWASKPAHGMPPSPPSSGGGKAPQGDARPQSNRHDSVTRPPGIPPL